MEIEKLIYECSGCSKSYEIEQEAIDCCNQMKYDENDEIISFSKMKLIAKTHCCPNVTYGDKSWCITLAIDEECPMCGYVLRLR